MALFKKKPDPISDRARVLSNEIAQLEEQIEDRDAKLKRNEPHPGLRSTAVPHGATVTHSVAEPAVPPAPRVEDPIFEEMGRDLLKARTDGASTPEHFNEL